MTNSDHRVEERSLVQEMQDSYAAYAMAVIIGRALPDVRDGLKPIHRRLLYTMHELGLDWDKPHKKSARIDGDCTGKYSPHGCLDYDTLVPLLSGRKAKLGDLVKEGEDQWVYSVDSSNNIMPALASKFRVGKTVGKSLEIKLKGVEAAISATHNHKFFTLSRGWLRADELKQHDILFSSSLQVDERGYYVLSHCAEHRTVHRLVSEHFTGKKSGNGLNVHHSDHNKTNNQPDNLCLITTSEHGLHHAEAGETTRFNSESSIWHEHREATKLKNSALISEYNKNQGLLKAIKILKELELCGESLTEIAYERLRVTKKRGQGPRLDRLLSKRNITFEQLLTLKEEFRLDTSSSKGFTRVSNTLDELPTGKLKKGFSGRDNKTWEVMSLQQYATIRALMGFNSEYDCIRPKRGLKLATILTKAGVESESELYSKLSGRYLTVVESVTEVVHETKDFYDFTVDGTENLLIELDEGKLVCAHNSAYGAMVTLAAIYTRVLPLIDGHGNWGTLTDSAAAGRYTEARLSKYSQFCLLRDLSRESVEWRDNYDASLKEPVTLPAQLPNLLFSDTEGIAVGYACSHLPYNYSEVCELVRANINARALGKQLSPAEILNIIKGPDFVSSAELVRSEGLEQAILTGHGSMRLNSVWHREDCTIPGKRNKQITGSAVVVTEVPFRVDAENIADEIGALAKDGHLEDLVAVQNESARGETRLVLMFKPECNIEQTMSFLFRKTQLSKSVSANALCIVGMRPVQLGVNQIVTEWLDFRLETLGKLFREQLLQLQLRLHLVEGHCLIVDRIDDAIRIIRAAETTKAARVALCVEFKLSPEQADSILEIQLRRLTKLEADQLLKTQAQLIRDIARVEKLLRDERSLLNYISKQVDELSLEFKQERRTRLVDAVAAAAQVEGEKTTQKRVAQPRGGHLCYIGGKISTAPRQLKLGKDKSNWSAYSDDLTQLYLGVMLSNGRIYRIRASEISKPDTIKFYLSKRCRDVDLTQHVVFQCPWSETMYDVDHCYAVLTSLKFKVAPSAHFFALQRGGQVFQPLEEGETIVQVLGLAKPHNFVTLKGATAVELSRNILQSRHSRGVLNRGVDSLEMT